MRKRQYECPIVELDLCLDADFIMTSFDNVDFDNDILNEIDFS